MGYKDLVDIEDELQNKPDLDSITLKRIPTVERLVEDFIIFYEKKYGVILSAINDISPIISYFYFSMCIEHVKPVIDDRINRFKMASLMELIIVKEQVLIHPEAVKSREANAVFGMTAACSLINCMIHNARQELFCDTLNASVNEKVQKMIEDHRLWLETKQLNDMPVFINAQFYEFMEMVPALPLQIHAH